MDLPKYVRTGVYLANPAVVCILRWTWLHFKIIKLEKNKIFNLKKLLINTFHFN